MKAGVSGSRGRPLGRVHLSAFDYNDAGLILADLRMVKDSEEMVLMEQAARMADAGIRAAHEFIRPGIRERDVAAYMEQELQKLAVEPPFYIHVARGPRSAITGDITRTFPVGQVSGPMADAIARDLISAEGYGPFFTHRTGHGLGLEAHHEPNIVGGNHRSLGAGCTFTIEPGIYVPGMGGVRIEDDVVLVPEGVRSLTQYPRELL